MSTFQQSSWPCETVVVVEQMRRKELREKIGISKSEKMEVEGEEELRNHCGDGCWRRKRGYCGQGNRFPLRNDGYRQPWQCCHRRSRKDDDL
ncbi:hypothetical protein VNO77_20601 [Canavalia gladiata]|uniref:Uncharacterized protein n=1 Tax=Canavalia gladiata TaxID=3824 RepID=A0AAN9LPS5_CANGL